LVLFSTLLEIRLSQTSQCNTQWIKNYLNFIRHSRPIAGRQRQNLDTKYSWIKT